MEITLARIDDIRDASFHIYRKDGSEDYLFVHFKSPAYVYVDGIYTEVDKGNCICFEKKTFQDYYPFAGMNFVHDFIHFDLENEVERILFRDIPRNKIIHLLMPQLITDALFAIQTENTCAPTKYQKNILTQLGMVFLYQLKNETELDQLTMEKRKNYKVLHELRIQIYQTPQLNWSIDNIAKKACISRSYLQHLYKEYFGISCIQDIVSARIETAKTLLRSSDLTVNEVAEKCGYQNIPHFINQFKQIVGVTPNKFR